MSNSNLDFRNHQIDCLRKEVERQIEIQRQRHIKEIQDLVEKTKKMLYTATSKSEIYKINKAFEEEAKKIDEKNFSQLKRIEEEFLKSLIKI